MALALSAEQEAIVERSVREGRYATAGDALEAALNALEPSSAVSLHERSRRNALRAKSLYELMQQSPFYGSDIEFERDRSPMRAIDL